MYLEKILELFENGLLYLKQENYCNFVGVRSRSSSATPAANMDDVSRDSSDTPKKDTGVSGEGEGVKEKNVENEYGKVREREVKETDKNVQSI